MARARTLVLNTKVDVTGADKLRGLGRTLQQTGSLLTAGLTLPILGIGAAMVTAAEDAARAQAKLKNTFDSMGAAAFTSIKALNEHAEALQNATTFDDETINEAQAVLLTFGNITGDAFTRATEAALDMTSLFEGDLQSAIVQVGKALNDPIKGVTALTRVGVSFTQQQLEQIKVLQQSGDILGAQTIILAELERQFGGTAEALAQTAGGQMTQALNQLNDAAEDFGEILAPMLVEVAHGVKDFVKFVRELNPETKKLVIHIAALAAALGPLLIVFGSILRVLGPFTKAIGVLTAPGGLPLLISKLRGFGLAAATVTSSLAIADLNKGLIGVREFASAFGQEIGPFGQQADAFNRGLLKMVEGSDDVRADMEAIYDRLLSFQQAGATFDQAMRAVAAGLSLPDWQKQQEDLAAASAAWNGLWDPLVDQTNSAANDLDETVDEMVEIVGRAPGDLANELRGGIDDYDEALQELTDVAVNSVSDLAERQKIEGILASTQLTDALHSDSTRTRLLALELVDDLVADYELLAPGARRAGNLVVPAFADGMFSNIGLAVNTAEAIVDAAGAPLVNLDASAGGFSLINSWINGMDAAWATGVNRVYAITTRAGRILGLSLPTEGPLAGGIASGGYSIIESWFSDMDKAARRGMGTLAGIAAAAGAALVTGNMPDIPRASAVFSGAGTGRASVTNNFYLRWDGEPPKGRNEEEIIGNLQRLSPLVGLVGGT